MTVYNGKLYAGVGYITGGFGDVIVCNPDANDPDNCDATGEWTVSFNGAEEEIAGVAVYNGKTYAEARAATYPVKFSVGTGTSQKIGNLWFENKDEWGTSGGSGADVGVFKLSHALITTAGFFHGGG